MPAWGGLVAEEGARRTRLRPPWKYGRPLAWYWRTIKWSALVVPDGEP